MRSKCPPGQRRGISPPLDADMGQIPGAPLGGLDRGRSDVARQQAVAAPGEHLGQHADGAAGLKARGDSAAPEAARG